MQTALYVALSSQISQLRKVDSLSQNVANANTVGYRAEVIRFSEVVAKTGSVNSSFTKASSEIISRRSGGITHTGNATDLAIAGDGWFAVRGSDGQAYTRDGRLSISGNGYLTNLAGLSVLDVGGGAIMLDPAGPPPEISRDGAITQGGVQAGVLGIFKLPSDARLTRHDNVSLVSDAPALPVVDFTNDGVIQGAVENSNVDSIQEISSLISAQRHFESISASIGSAEESLSEAIRMLGPTSR